jgi:hypothetical protein
LPNVPSTDVPSGLLDPKHSKTLTAVVLRIDTANNVQSEQAEDGKLQPEKIEAGPPVVQKVAKDQGVGSQKSTQTLMVKIRQQNGYIHSLDRDLFESKKRNDLLKKSDRGAKADGFNYKQEWSNLQMEKHDYHEQRLRTRKLADFILDLVDKVMVSTQQKLIGDFDALFESARGVFVNAKVSTIEDSVQLAPSASRGLELQVQPSTIQGSTFQ